MKNTILFDLDGTLINSIPDLTTAVNITMTHYHFPTHTEADVTTFVNYGARRVIELALPEDKRADGFIDEVLAYYLDAYARHVCEKTYPYDGITDMLVRLKNDGKTLAVVSNKPDLHVRLITEKLFPPRIFSYEAGSGYGKPSKPDKACVDNCMTALGITDRNDILYVGDSVVDVATAANSGLTMIGVCWGFAGTDSFTTAMPPYTASTVEELENYLRTLA